ncbi:MAG: hypothetical protein V8S36_00520 [Lachnospiraceae bacterium]
MWLFWDPERAAYAMNVGGIQRTIQIWIHGDQTDAQFVVEDGSYTLDYEDENGEAVHRGGGGVAIEDDGTERSLTEEELMEEINSPEVSMRKTAVYGFTTKIRRWTLLTNLKMASAMWN